MAHQFSRRRFLMTLTCGAAGIWLSNQRLTAAQEVNRSELKFKRGTSSTTVEDVIVRGSVNRYEFSANAGQTLSVAITSPENNAVFGLYVVSPYGYSDLHNEDDDVAFSDIAAFENGNEPVNPGIDDERTSWRGSLPFGSKTGQGSQYAIVVGSTRGNAGFSLKVSIK